MGTLPMYLNLVVYSNLVLKNCYSRSYAVLASHKSMVIHINTTKYDLLITLSLSDFLSHTFYL